MFCFWILSLVFCNDSCSFCRLRMEPQVGFEPTTYALQVRCTASCATAAYKGSNLRQSDYYIVELYPFRFRIFLMSTGASRRARTFDIRINSASLCQLSYRGINHEGRQPSYNLRLRCLWSILPNLPSSSCFSRQHRRVINSAVCNALFHLSPLC